MAKATSDASGQSTSAAIGDTMGPIVSGIAILPRSYFPGGGLSSEWAALDPNANGDIGADCATVAQLMKSELEILGVTGAQIKYVYARNASWNGLSQGTPNGWEDGPPAAYPPNATASRLILWMGFFNLYEACCFFNGKYWMGNLGESRTKAIDVLSKTVDYPNVNNGANTQHQAWSYYYPAIQQEIVDSAHGVAFPTGTPPTY